MSHSCRKTSIVPNTIVENDDLRKFPASLDTINKHVLAFALKCIAYDND